MASLMRTIFWLLTLLFIVLQRKPQFIEVWGFFNGCVNLILEQVFKNSDMSLCWKKTLLL